MFSCAGCSYPDGRLFWPRWKSFGTQAFAVKQSWDQGGFNILLALTKLRGLRACFSLLQSYFLT